MSGREYVIDAVVDAFWPKIGIRAQQGYIITKYVIQKLKHRNLFGTALQNLVCYSRVYVLSESIITKFFCIYFFKVGGLQRGLEGVLKLLPRMVVWGLHCRQKSAFVALLQDFGGKFKPPKSPFGFVADCFVYSVMTCFSMSSCLFSSVLEHFCNSYSFETSNYVFTSVYACHSLPFILSLPVFAYCSCIHIH